MDSLLGYIQKKYSVVDRAIAEALQTQVHFFPFQFRFKTKVNIYGDFECNNVQLLGMLYKTRSTNYSIFHVCAAKCIELWHK
jgi:hypothetical protein